MTKGENKKHFTIKFSIPLKLFEPFEKIGYQWRKLQFRLAPFHCDCCGKRMMVRSPQYEHHFTDAHGNVGSRLMVENLIFGKSICRTCLVNELETKEWTPRFTHSTKERRTTNRYNYRFWSTKQCDVTGKKGRAYKDVEIYPHVDMTFCTIAWNHSYISKEAVIETVKHGRVRTSHWGVWNKTKMAPMNEARLFINDDGDLL